MDYNKLASMMADDPLLAAYRKLRPELNLADRCDVRALRLKVKATPTPATGTTPVSGPTAQDTSGATSEGTSGGTSGGGRPKSGHNDPAKPAINPAIHPAI